MPHVKVTREDFLADRQGKTFADVVHDRAQPFDVAIEFFSDPARQRRMEESELHHDRAPLAGVVRELEAQPEIDRFLACAEVRRNTRFRQAIGVLVRIIMEHRGWRKTGRKGSLGVRATAAPQSPAYNAGGLAFWFCRAERYQPVDGSPFPTVQHRRRELESVNDPSSGKRKASGHARK
jgi:hypothetical protein